MIKKEEIIIDCLSDEKRYLTIYIPDNKNNYPVLYMMDGQNVFFDEDATFGKCWGLLDYFKKNKTKMIIVGIDSSRGIHNERLSEYSPYDFFDDSFGNVKGRAKKFIKWLVNDLKPYIDSNYNALSNRENTYIAGSSMGGLVSLYALLEYNDIFKGAACLSPSLWANNEKLISLIKRSKIKDDTLLYLDYGSLEAKKGKFAKNALCSFWKCVEELRNKPINLNIHVIQNSGHNEASWQKQIPVFISMFERGY